MASPVPPAWRRRKRYFRDSARRVKGFLHKGMRRRKFHADRNLEPPAHPKHRGRFNPRDRARYVVEVMGFKDLDYVRDKEKTHPRMRRIGRLFPMEGSKFDSVDNTLRRQREEITAKIEKDILERWTASETT